MGVGKDEWEKAREEREDREAARSLIETAEAVGQRVGEQEWQRVHRIRQAGFWVMALGLLGAGWMLLNLLWHFGKSWLARVRPSVVIEPPPEGRIALFGVGLGVGVALLVVGALVVWFAERRLRRAVGSDEDAEAALMYLSLGAETWEKAAGEVGEEAAPTRAAPQVVQRDEWEERHWLRTELSGANLIWWLSFIAVGVYMLGPVWLALRPPSSPEEAEVVLEWLPPDWLMNGLFAVAGVGLVLKVLVPLIWFDVWKACGRNPETRRQLKRYHRFWAKGLLPAALALGPAVIYWGVHALLWG